MPVILLARNADAARHILTVNPVVLTVEAEYGSYVAEGSRYTAAHHQPAGTPFAGRHVVQDGRPAPSNDQNIPVLGDADVILVSHLDLDTYGGCLRAMPEFVDLFPKHLEVRELGDDEPLRPTIQALLRFVDWNRFWNMSEYVDVNGVHKIPMGNFVPRTITQMHAFWAWDEARPRDPSADVVLDVTDIVREAGRVLRAIVDEEDATLLVAGRARQEEQVALNARTFLRWEDGILVRKATRPREFVNHLYNDPDGRVGDAIVGMSASGGITISISDPKNGVSCREIVQGLWGPEAGGHEEIAGSPRGRVMTDDDLQDVLHKFAEALGSA